MKMQNIYTRGYIEYPLYFELEKLHYDIRHETPFSERYSSWAVSILETGDYIYVPYAENRARDIYIVTSFFINKEVAFPHGIYKIPMSYFTTAPNITVNDDEFFDGDDDDFFID